MSLKNRKCKFPISDNEMQVLLKKYPFLRYRNAWTGKQVFHGKSQNLETNYYKYWDGSGWEELWKKKYLPRLFKEYDTWSKADKKNFMFLDVKEKFGELRIYTNHSTNLEFIAESLSGWTCEFCGKTPRENGKRVIWTTSGWIMNLCEDCARKHIEANFDTKKIDVEKMLTKMKNVQEKPFGYTRYSKDTQTTVLYKETNDGWLEKDQEIEKPRIKDET